MRWVGSVTRVTEKKNAHRILVGNLKGRYYFGYVEIKLKGMECEGVDWIRLAQDVFQWRDLVGTVLWFLRQGHRCFDAV
jgi:hypothetical protein